MSVPGLSARDWVRFGAPASQDSSHVGNAGDKGVSLRGAPVALPTFATAQFQRFFDCGRAVRCLLPKGGGRFMNLVVLYGYQEADADAEQLALTGQLFDAIVGDFNAEPTKILCLSTGNLGWTSGCLEAAWALARAAQPKRRDFAVLLPFDFRCGSLQRSPLWPAAWLTAVEKSRRSKSVEVQRVWEVYDDRVRIMSMTEVLQLDVHCEGRMFLGCGGCPC